MVETAKENGLNAEDYLEYILTYGPCTSKDKYDTLLPWNVDMSRIEKLHEAKANAKPDPNRTKPYILLDVAVNFSQSSKDTLYCVFIN